MSRGATYGSVCVLAAAVLWGTTGTAAALAPGVGSLAVGAAAMGVGGLLQAAVALRVVRAHRVDLWVQWRTLAVAAGAVAVYPLAFYSSMRLAGVAVGTVVSIGSAPVAAALVERVVDHQPLSRRWAIGAAAAVVGVMALAISRTGHAQPATGASGALPVLGIALGLLAGLTYALYSWGAARMMRGGLPTRPVMGAIFGLGGVLLMPVLLLTGAPIVETGRNLAVVAYLAVVPMFFGYVLFGRGLATVSATTATTLSLLEPAVAAGIAVLVLHEGLPVLGWAGMTILLASLVLLTADSRQQNPDTASTPPPVGLRREAGQPPALTAAGGSSSPLRLESPRELVASVLQPGDCLAVRSLRRLLICSSGSSVTIRNTLSATLYTSSLGVKGRPWLTSGRARAALRAVSWRRSPAALTGPPACWCRRCAGRRAARPWAGGRRRAGRSR